VHLPNAIIDISTRRDAQKRSHDRARRSAAPRSISAVAILLPAHPDFGKLRRLLEMRSRLTSSVRMSMDRPLSCRSALSQMPGRGNVRVA
jgi:hypothetical protein